MDAVQDLRPDSRLLTVTTSVHDGAGVILVEDNGPSISELIKDRLFDSFFTTKREGLGMGLSICRSIVESLGGRLIAENREEAEPDSASRCRWPRRPRRPRPEPLPPPLPG